METRTLLTLNRARYPPPTVRRAPRGAIQLKSDHQHAISEHRPGSTGKPPQQPTEPRRTTKSNHHTHAPKSTAAGHNSPQRPGADPQLDHQLTHPPPPLTTDHPPPTPHPAAESDAFSPRRATRQPPTKSAIPPTASSPAPTTPESSKLPRNKEKHRRVSRRCSSCFQEPGSLDTDPKIVLAGLWSRRDFLLTWLHNYPGVIGSFMSHSRAHTPTLFAFYLGVSFVKSSPLVIRKPGVGEALKTEVLIGCPVDRRM